MSHSVKAADLPALAGREFGPSSWLEITQERIDRFADATEDHQFIHVDAERAAGTPFGGTIAHGFLTLSLQPHLTAEIAPQVENLLMGINYGIDKLRFLQPVRSGSRVRARQVVLEVNEKNPGQWLMKSRVTVESRASRNPPWSQKRWPCTWSVNNKGTGE